MPGLAGNRSQSGFLAGDVAGITLGATRAVGQNVGPYAMTPADMGGNIANYNITMTPGNFTSKAVAA